ncbi:MAG: PorV/PorQ family protein [Elusimicrobiota bacterium]
MKSLLLAVLLAAAPSAPAWAAFGARQAGTSGAPFLNQGADARAAGMGNAVSASADDASATYWNPADLAGLHYRHAMLTHTASYKSTFYDFLAYAHPVEIRRGSERERDLLPDQLGTIGACLLYQNAGSLSEVDNTGTPTGQSFTPQDFAVSLGWGAELARGLDAGIAVKYVTSKIQASASTGAVDFGARWRATIPGTEFGYTLSADARNVGGQLKFHDESDPLPLIVVVGQALHPFRALTLEFDYNAPRDAAAYPSFGVEWRAPMTEGLTAALRAGYDGRVKKSDLGGTTGITFGGGLGFQRFGFDYAWSPAGDLGSTQRLSLSYRF